jgi:hypothetical protein
MASGMRPRVVLVVSEDILHWLYAAEGELFFVGADRGSLLYSAVAVQRPGTIVNTPRTEPWRRARPPARQNQWVVTSEWTKWPS